METEFHSSRRNYPPHFVLCAMVFHSKFQVSRTKRPSDNQLILTRLSRTPSRWTALNVPLWNLEDKRQHLISHLKMSSTQSLGFRKLIWYLLVQHTHTQGIRCPTRMWDTWRHGPRFMWCWSHPHNEPELCSVLTIQLIWMHLEEWLTSPSTSLWKTLKVPLPWRVYKKNVIHKQPPNRE